MKAKILCMAFVVAACLLSQSFAQTSVDDLDFQRSEDGSFSLCPDTTLSRAAIATWEKDEKPVYIAENLYRVKKATLVSNSVAPKNADTSLAQVSRVIRSVSKMQGMKYYSNSDKKWAVLYEEAHLIDAPDTKQTIADQTDGDADGKLLYCILKDHTFGKGVYRLDYQQRENEVSVCFTNEAAMKVLGITGVKPGYMKINLVVIDNELSNPADDSYTIYMVIQAKYPSISFLENMLRKSFYARLDAIYNWFIKQF